MYKVYQYIFPDGKMYIGTTKNDIATRRDQGYQHNKKLQNAMRSVGWENIKVNILNDNLNQQEAFEKEKHYISVLDSNNPEIGYNVSKGGKETFSGLHHTEKNKKYISNKLKGREFTKEHIENLKNSHKFQKKAVERIVDDWVSIKYY